MFRRSHVCMLRDPVWCSTVCEQKCIGYLSESGSVQISNNTTDLQGMTKIWSITNSCNWCMMFLLISKQQWKKIHNEEINDLNSSPNIFQMIKSRRIRWAGHVECMGRRELYTGLWWGNLRERDHLGDPGVDWKIILRWIFRKWDVDWIELAQDWDGWRPLVNAIINLAVP